MDETYIRVGGTWCYLYRAITAGGQTLDFYLSPKRNVAAAKRFLAKTLRSNTITGFPRVINTDKAPSLARAIAELKSEGICPQTVEHRQVKYLNNVIEGDHGRLKRILGPKGAFKNRTSAYRTLKGMEDAFIAERSGHDVCLWAPQSGRGDRQPGLRDGLRTPARSGHQEMRNWVVSALRPTLQQHRCNHPLSWLPRPLPAMDYQFTAD